MIKLLKRLVPTFVRIYINQYRNKRKYDVKFGKGATASNTYFEGKNFVNNNSLISNSNIGLATYISGGCNLSRIKIGRFCSIGQNLKNQFSLHPSSQFVSTHPAFFSTKKQAGFTFVKKNIFEESRYADKDKKYYSIIGNDVWIGNDVKIMEGVYIGDGAIIAAGAIVTKDVSPYTTVGGIPAKLIRKRFNNEQIEFLVNFKWWNKDFEWLKKYAYLFTSIAGFKKYYE